MPGTRKHERVPLPLEVRWSGQSGHQSARISDVSLGGCYIESLAQVTIGESIGFEIQLPTGNWMPLFGKVVYTLSNLGFGVEFNPLSELQSNVLTDLIDFAK
jgi:hypothetical protein